MTSQVIMAGTVAVTSGGTGRTAFSTANSIVCVSTSVNAIGIIPPSATNLPLVSNGTVAAATFQFLPVTGGGTGRITSTTPYGVICAGTIATGAQQTTASAGTSGQVLTSAGASALPTWSAPTGGAVKADQTTGTSTIVFVNPAVQQYHASASKAWLQYNSITQAIPGSYNITSVTAVSTGVFTINFTVSFATTAYCVSTCIGQTASSSALNSLMRDVDTTPALGSCQMLSAYVNTTNNFTLSNYAENYMSFFGGQ